MSTTPRLLITGSSGFIGSHMLREARAAGYELWVAVRAGAQLERLEREGIRYVEVNYYDAEQMRSAFHVLSAQYPGEPLWHYVIHNAGITKTARLEEFQEVNAEHTLRLLSALIDLPQPPERFVLMSSLSSYGDIHRDDTPLRADDPQRPTTRYGRSKCLAEHYTEQSGLPFTILLPTGVYGPGDKDYLMSLRGIAGGINAMAGCQTQYLTFVHGADVARAALHVLSRPEAEGERYIVSDGATYTDIEYGRLVQRLLGRRRVLHLRVPLPLLWGVCQLGSLWARLSGKVTPLNRDKYPILAQRNWRCDPSPLIALGWRPRYDLEEGLRDTLEVARAQGLL
ncbi:NAD(P)-dependent oxidoreductase [uncultured Porphyromonas sp.]|uniref:NAD-dependent epimerase/dehydratase family protein n=1 Tax=uncultured Porphyromonas sp. TaxID=159274 RepID=UPI002632A5F6|nr:NAD(P)-dependent oxidoreductase [uncultured Porphyromonas sp.]